MFIPFLFLALLTQETESNKLYLKGKAELIDDRFERAIELFSEVVSRFPASEEADDAQFYIGIAWEHLGRDREALAAYNAVIKRWPESVRVESARDHRAELAPALAPAGRNAILDDIFSGSSWELKRDTAFALAREGNLSAADVLEETMERESSSRQLEILRILKPRVSDEAARRVVLRGLDPGRSTGVQLRALQALEPVAFEEDVARAIEVLLSSGASTSVSLEAVRALGAHLDRPNVRRAASRALDTGEATAVQILACSTFAPYLLREELRPSVARLFRESNATASQLQCLRSLSPRADDLAVAELLEEAVGSPTTATAVKLEAVSIAARSALPEVRAAARAGLRSGNATSVQLGAVKTLASGKDDESAAQALERLFGGSGVATSVLLAGLDSLSRHLSTNAGPRALAGALTSNASTSVELRAIEIGAPLVSNPEVRGAVVRCLTSGHSTSVVLAALKALDGRVASDREVKDAFTRVLENEQISSAARVRAGASLLPAADAALTARIADAMEEVVAKARRHGGNREVVERALSVLERIDRERAERLRARGDGRARGSASALMPGLYPSPAL